MKGISIQLLTDFPQLFWRQIDSTNSPLSETEDDFGDEDLTVSEADVDDDNTPCMDFDSCDEVEELF